MTEAQKQHRAAKTTVAQYKSLNAGTVERVKAYDPKLRCWTFERLKVDENASKFNNEPRKSTAKDRNERIIEMHRAGKNNKVIAGALFVNYKTVCRIVRDYKNLTLNKERP